MHWDGDSLKSGFGRKPRGARDAVSAAAAQVGAGARMKLVVNQVSACLADMHEPHLAESSDWCGLGATHVLPWTHHGVALRRRFFKHRLAGEQKHCLFVTLLDLAAWVPLMNLHKASHVPGFAILAHFHASSNLQGRSAMGKIIAPLGELKASSEELECSARFQTTVACFHTLLGALHHHITSSSHSVICHCNT